MMLFLAGLLAIVAPAARAEADIWSAYVDEMRHHLQMSVSAPANQTAHVCYKDLGCFYKDNGTFQHVRMLPDMVDTFFVIYTRKTINAAWFQNEENMATVPKWIDPNKPVKVIIHGFGGHFNLPWIMNMRNAFLRKEDATVVAVDWSQGSKVPNYFQSAVNTEVVGRQVARFLMAMPVPEKSLHVIGFSLGAQTAGFAGEYFIQHKGKKIGRITALDAAGPLFEKHGDRVHLDQNDADLVDAIHTNGESFMVGGVGMAKPYGHVDFYPNGGKRQPGCSSTLTGGIKDLITGKRERVCNHERAPLLFIESITGCQFRGFRCSDNDYRPEQCSLQMADGVMGYDTKGDGIYFTTTAKDDPYCAIQYEVEIVASEGKATRGTLALMLKDKRGVEEIIPIIESNRRIIGGQVIKAILGSRVTPDHIATAGILYKRSEVWLLKGLKEFYVDRMTLRHPEATWVENCQPKTLLLTGEMTKMINSPCSNN